MNPYKVVVSWNAKSHRADAPYHLNPQVTCFLIIFLCVISANIYTPHYQSISILVIFFSTRKCQLCRFICNFIIQSGKVSDFRKTHSSRIWHSGKVRFSWIVVFIVISCIEDWLKMSSKVDETTPMVGDPGYKKINHEEFFADFWVFSGPSYVIPGQTPRLRDRQVKQFQCCICTGLM